MIFARWREWVAAAVSPLLLEAVCTVPLLEVRVRPIGGAGRRGGIAARVDDPADRVGIIGLARYEDGKIIGERQQPAVEEKHHAEQGEETSETRQPDADLCRGGARKGRGTRDAESSGGRRDGQYVGGVEVLVSSDAHAVW